MCIGFVFLLSVFVFHILTENFFISQTIPQTFKTRNPNVIWEQVAPPFVTIVHPISTAKKSLLLTGNLYPHLFRGSILSTISNGTLIR